MALSSTLSSFGADNGGGGSGASNGTIFFLGLLPLVV